MRERRCISTLRLALIVARLMSEVAQIEIAAEFPIDARQQVQVESGGDADGIVIGADQAARGLSPDRRPGAANRPGARAARIGAGRRRLLRGRSCRWCCRGTGSAPVRRTARRASARSMPFQIGCLRWAGTSRRAETRACAAQLRARRARYRWGSNRHGAGRAAALRMWRVLVPVPLPSSTMQPGIACARDDLIGGVARSRRPIGARQPIFRQQRDDFEQRGPDVVVQPGSRQRFSSW